RRVPLCLPDVVRPSLVKRYRVDAQSDDPRVAPIELGLHSRHVSELGRTHGGEVLWVREEYYPGLADPLMEANRALGGFSFKIRSDIANSKSHAAPPLQD